MSRMHQICFMYTQRFNVIYLDVLFNKFCVPLEFIFFQEEPLMRWELNQPCIILDEMKLFGLLKSNHLILTHQITIRLYIITL